MLDWRRPTSYCAVGVWPQPPGSRSRWPLNCVGLYQYDAGEWKLFLWYSKQYANAISDSETVINRSSRALLFSDNDLRQLIVFAHILKWLWIPRFLIIELFSSRHLMWHNVVDGCRHQTTGSPSWDQSRFRQFDIMWSKSTNRWIQFFHKNVASGSLYDPYTFDCDEFCCIKTAEVVFASMLFLSTCL